MQLARDRLILARAVASRRAADPSEWYEASHPTSQTPLANQLAFHRATQPIRLLVPGNGWGKTTAMGMECHTWAMHTNQWQRTPRWPLLMVWFVKLQDQFELMRVQLTDMVFGSIAVWKNGRFTWPDGSQLFIASADRREDWRKWQGVPVDLLCFDEEPPQGLWREMSVRRRAMRKTRYVIGATATNPESWMETELYRPWLQHHQDQGLTEEEALFTNNHPRVWAWTMGGIGDNPAADASDVAWYDEMTKPMHPKERKVRLKGGFESWVGDGVFDDDALEWMEGEAFRLDGELGEAIRGWFEPVLPRGM